LAETRFTLYFCKRVDLRCLNYAPSRFPALGLRWWIDEGRPTGDERFALIEQTWFGDGQFDGFSSWLWANPGMAFGPEPRFSRRERAEPLAAREWLKAVSTSFEERGLVTP
jgi:hypothetical protein